MISKQINTAWALLIALVLLPIMAAASGFEEVVQPYLKENCIRCHGPEKEKGKLTLHQITEHFGTDAEVEGWVDILDMLSFGEMPPPDEEKQPDPLATAQIVSW
ncbi:MAG: hypothetical protein ACJA16_002088, partial [Akkermansiaceae bacterium]